VVRELQPEDPRLIGPYRLVGRLGEGGMGQVFLGLSAGDRRVAVKVIRAELAADPEFRLRFRREVAAARKVSGLFTAMVADADTEAPRPWLATAYVPGPSLAEAVREHGPLSPDSVLKLAAGLAESLVAIHGAGVVHRDLKPSNVLLGEDGPCVIDFGISRATEATSLTGKGFVVGSPGFMSPEQAEGDQVGPPSDIFSLGALLAFAASGEPPFGHGSSAALVYRVVHSQARLNGVPEQIRPLIGRCLVKDPGQRPTASGLLAGIAAARPVTSRLPQTVVAAPPDRPAPTRPPEARPPEPGPPEPEPQEAGPPVVRPPRSPRPLVVGAAAAVVLIAATATWLANADGPGHPTPGSGNKDAAIAVTPPEVSLSAQSVTPTGQRSGDAAKKHPRASSSGRAGTQSATPDATMSALATRSAPATRSASARPVTSPSSRPAKTLAYSFSYSGASENSCADEGSVSSSDGAPVEFAFTDDAPAEVEIFSIGASGAVAPYAVIDQGGTLTVSTNVGDYWVLGKPSGSCLAVFAINGGGKVVVG
jgi:eukaryotic-like serine/threonine-protein kinase